MHKIVWRKKKALNHFKWTCIYLRSMRTFKIITSQTSVKCTNHCRCGFDLLAQFWFLAVHDGLFSWKICCIQKYIQTAWEDWVLTLNDFVKNLQIDPVSTSALMQFSQGVAFMQKKKNQISARTTGNPQTLGMTAETVQASLSLDIICFHKFRILKKKPWTRLVFLECYHKENHNKQLCCLFQVWQRPSGCSKVQSHAGTIFCGQILQICFRLCKW